MFIPVLYYFCGVLQCNQPRWDSLKGWPEGSLVTCHQKLYMGSWKHGSCPPNLLSRWCFWSGCISSNHPATARSDQGMDFFPWKKSRHVEVTISTLTVLPITLGPSLAGGVRQGSDIQYDINGSDGGNIITSTVKTDTLDRQTIHWDDYPLGK